MFVIGELQRFGDSTNSVAMWGTACATLQVGNPARTQAGAVRQLGLGQAGDLAVTTEEVAE